MYALAKVLNLVLVAIAVLLVALTGEAPWLWLVAAVVVTAAAPANFILAKNILLDRAISVKANVRKFARRRMETASFWFAIGATVMTHGIIKAFYTGENSWIPFLPVAIFIIGWSLAGKFRFDPNKYDNEAEKQA